jgi:hypothetical protein
MKKFSKKSVVLFAGVMAVCALAMPSMASALSWSPVGGASHPLTSTNLSFISEGASSFGSTCAQSTLTEAVPNGSVANITTTSFTNCMGLGVAVNCTLTPVGTNLPWAVTATNPLQIPRFHMTIHFENTPGNPTACAIPITITLTGALTGGTFNNVEHGVTLTSATGLVGHSAGQPTLQVTVSGTIRDSDSAAGHQLTLS